MNTSITSVSLKLLCAATFIAVGACVVAPAAMAEQTNVAKEPLRVTVDRAKIMRLSRSAETIIIGNPLIADATVQDSRTVVLSGRSPGVTNLVILDAEGEPIVDEMLIIGAAELKSVRIYRRADRETFACSPICEPTLTIGDEKETFERNAAQIGARNALSVGGKF